MSKSQEKSSKRIAMVKVTLSAFYAAMIALIGCLIVALVFDSMLCLLIAFFITVVIGVIAVVSVIILCFRFAFRDLRGRPRPPSTPPVPRDLDPPRHPVDRKTEK